jgi:cytochrome c oxidase cbb3-type subunit 1
MQGKPFIDGVTLMEPYWLWRAIGGSLMWLSHLFFAYNMYRMIVQRPVIDVRETAIQQLQEKTTLTTQPGI